MKINIITERSDWILNRAAKELAELDPANIRINDHLFDSDINYYLPYLTFKRKTNKLDVGFFTHLEDRQSQNFDAARKAGKFRSFSKLFDGLISISTKTSEKLDRKSQVIKMGSQFKKPILFGVCGKVHASGRKNESFIKRLKENGFNVIAWGEGWPCSIISNRLDRLRTFYESIDYLIIPSGIEGGPVPVLEAISLGVPVIAPDVGWCWDYPVIPYLKNDYDSLERVVRSLAESRTWEDWRQDHKIFFTKLLEGRSQPGQNV